MLLQYPVHSELKYVVLFTVQISIAGILATGVCSFAIFALVSCPDPLMKVWERDYICTCAVASTLQSTDTG